MAKEQNKDIPNVKFCSHVKVSRCGIVFNKPCYNKHTKENAERNKEVRAHPVFRNRSLIASHLSKVMHP